METDQQENPREQMTSSGEQGGSQSAGRSYECNFCKRGFSNAQALGGHMNIHRKDKAKLRQLAISNTNVESQQFSLDNIPKNNITASSYSPIPTNATHVQPSKEEAKPSDHEERSKIQWQSWVLGKEGDHDHTNKKDVNTHVGEIQQLPLFAEKPTSKDHQKTGSSTQVHVSNEKGLSSSHQDSSGSDQLVDLELRLGPERHHDSSAPATSTRKFF